MTTEAKTVTVELNVESAYRQLVGFQKAVAAFHEADENDDADARLAAANDAVDVSIDLINEIMPADLSHELHARLEQEHPELVQEDPLVALLREMFGDEGAGLLSDTDEN